MSSTKSWVKHETLNNNGGRFIIEPLERGMGNTIGNSLRRVLLSSLSGAAISIVKIEGVTHEFSTIPNVVEDVLDIICNLKSLVFVLEGEGPETLTLELKGKGKYKAKEIQVGSNVKILNKDLHIVELADGGALKMEMVLVKGVGFKPANHLEAQEYAADAIAVDCSFSPIIRVNHKVANIRVGKELDLDSVSLDVFTDGSITSEDTVKEASNILVGQFKLFQSINEKPEVEESQSASGDGQDNNSIYDMAIDDLELSARSSNCLKRAGIEIVGELLEKDMSELIQIKNFGKKSADEINDKLKQFNVALKGT